MEEPASSIVAASSLWGSLHSWFTSTVFFILLNLMIATILFTSNLPQNNQTQQQNLQEQQDDQNQKQNPQNHHPQIATSPSILNRLKSFNFLPQKPLIQDDNDDDIHHEHEPLHVAATQYVFHQPLHYQHFDFDSDQTHQVETVGNDFEFDPTRLEMGNVEDSGFDFDPTQKEDAVGELETFDFDPTQKENHYPSFDFDPTQKENEYPGFDFDPNREEGDGDDNGSDFDPTREDEQTDQLQSLDEVYSKLKGGGGGGHHDRTRSESEIRPKPTTKFKKSASLKVGFSHLGKEKTVETRRPATARERKSAASVTEDDDVEVDSKADDFINKFKNDLKLQRIESIMKSKSGKK